MDSIGVRFAGESIVMIGFLGLSHLGLHSSLAAAAKSKEKVIAYDPDGALCERLKKGELSVFEPGLQELLKSVSSRIEFTSDLSKLSQCSLLYLAPDTPTNDENKPDFSVLNALFESVLAHLSVDATLVVLSQIAPGTSRAFLAKLTQNPRYHKQKIYHQVETLIFGDAVNRAMNPERFIVGCEDAEAELPLPFAHFLAAFGCPVFKMNYESAELAKMSINLCIAATLSTANSLAELCEKINADWKQIEPVLRADRRIGPHAYLGAGLGIAGGNIERDMEAVKGLAAEWGTDGKVVESFLTNSRHRQNWAIKAVHEELENVDSQAVIAVWGLAYKADTHSTKNSPAVSLLRDLKSFSARIYDPKAILDKKEFPNAAQTSSALEACRGAHLLILMTPWKEFSLVSLARVREELAGKTVLDPFGVLDEKQCAKLGFHYRRLGTNKKETRS